MPQHKFRKVKRAANSDIASTGIIIFKFSKKLWGNTPKPDKTGNKIPAKSNKVVRAIIDHTHA